MATAGLVLGYLGVVFLPIAFFLAGITLPALAKAKSKAQQISCISNLKQIGLAARMYSNDNNGVFPKDVASLGKYLPSPKVLICPGDSNHSIAVNWDGFSETENLSYEFVAPGTKEDDSKKVLFRCPIHGHVVLGDGSVVQGRNRQF